MLSDAFEFIARYLWPAVLAWNVYLFRSQDALRVHQSDEKLALVEFKLFVAENYTSKQDLQDIFSRFEQRFMERLELSEKIHK
ncbi:hypothetical protein [Desulfoluna spongiiphila]|uniref:hypothetical protein n=1 Tax=Desulfoluna spongiiphila TaxID=419481 RepID=UPI001255BC11|nr:hypothetical protein [Desulfoluna spongiiphila]VVS90784.1 hypothetical protein DBB_3520 [Desulfoluna spongiiphila]